MWPGCSEWHWLQEQYQYCTYLLFELSIKPGRRQLGTLQFALPTVLHPVPPCSPHTELAAYTTEHPVYRHINMRLQVCALLW